MRSARPEDKTASHLGSKTENFREELPLLITRMGDSFVDMMAPQFQVRRNLSIIRPSLFCWNNNLAWALPLQSQKYSAYGRDLFRFLKLTSRQHMLRCSAQIAQSGASSTNRLWAGRRSSKAGKLRHCTSSAARTIQSHTLGVYDV